MSERIIELADKAIEDMPGPWNIPDEFCKKFAELIVRECSQIVYNSHPDDLPFVGGKMLVHFGVEG